jgi:Flp pilus assembly protein TadB
LYCTWCAEIIEEVKLASLSLGEESKTKKKEKGGKRELIFCLYLFMVAVLVVRGLLGLLLELLEFLDLVLILVLGSLVVDRLADYRHRLCMMVGFLGFLGLF